MGHLLGGSMVGLMATSSKRAYVTRCVTQVCCTQRPCPCGRHLLPCASTGDNQALTVRSGTADKSLWSGPHCLSHHGLQDTLQFTRWPSHLWHAKQAPASGSWDPSPFLEHSFNPAPHKSLPQVTFSGRSSIASVLAVTIPSTHTHTHEDTHAFYLHLFDFIFPITLVLVSCG